MFKTKDLNFITFSVGRMEVDMMNSMRVWEWFDITRH